MEYSVSRSFYRIRYPVTERPSFVSDEAVFVVLDCSEKGLLYHVGSNPLPKVGQIVAGQVEFRRGQRVDVEGEVVRVQDGNVALNLNAAGIPFAIILTEQRHLYRRYIGWS